LISDPLICPTLPCLQTAIRESVIAALLVVVVRLVAVVIGSYAGATAGGLKPEHQRVFWMSMITQVSVDGSCRVVWWLTLSIS
jgi:hypothetical protein